MSDDVRARFPTRTIMGAIVRWVVLFAGPLVLIVVFHGTLISYLLLLLLLGAGLGALKLRVHEFRVGRTHHPDAAG